MRPTYVTQPRRPVTLIVTPPPERARQLISRSWRSTRTGRPATATRAVLGANAKSTRTSPPRATTAVLVDAAIGAPQCRPQHHDDTASGTVLVPAVSDARGGDASATAIRSPITPGR